MKKLFVLVMLSCCLFLSCSKGSGSSSSSGTKAKYSVGVALYGLSGEYMRLFLTAIERHPDVVSGLVEITAYDGKYDAGVQYSQFETMVSRNHDGIIFVPIDIEAGAAAVDLAVAAGIPVVGANTRVSSDELLSYIGADDVLGGYLEMKAAIDAMGGSGNVVILEGPIGQSSQIERKEGNYKAIEEAGAGKVKVLEIRTANWSRAEALSLMENWISAHRDGIDAVIGQNDEMALGAVQAIRAAGMSIDDFIVVGIDGVSDALDAVKNDEMLVSILQDAVGQGQGSLDILLRHFEGESYKPKAASWANMDWGSSILPDYRTPWVTVTKDNADSLIQERADLTSN